VTITLIIILPRPDSDPDFDSDFRADFDPDFTGAPSFAGFAKGAQRRVRRSSLSGAHRFYLARC
jgi:hypothetical protein